MMYSFIVNAIVLSFLRAVDFFLQCLVDFLFMLKQYVKDLRTNDDQHNEILEVLKFKKEISELKKTLFVKDYQLLQFSSEIASLKRDLICREVEIHRMYGTAEEKQSPWLNFDGEYYSD